MRVIRFLLFVSIFFVITFEGTYAVKLRETYSIPLDNVDEIYGISSGNIIFKNETKLSFLDRKYKIRHEIELDSLKTAIVAKNGLYYGIVEKSVNDSDSLYSSNYVTIYNSRQNALWDMGGIIGSDYYLSPNGEYFIVISSFENYMERKLFFYRKDNPVKEFSVVGIQWLIISNDGKYFLVDCGSRGLKIYNNSGEEISELEHQRISAFGRNSEWNGHFVNDTLRIYEGDQERLSIKLIYHLLYALHILDQERKIVVGFPNNVIVLDLKDGSTIWQYSPGRDESEFVSLDVSPNNEYIACGVDINLGRRVEKGKRHVTGYLYLYDINGKSFESLEFNYSVYAAGLPRVRFLPDNKTISVETKEYLHFVEMY